MLLFRQLKIWWKNDEKTSFSAWSQQRKKEVCRMRGFEHLRMKGSVWEQIWSHPLPHILKCAIWNILNNPRSVNKSIVKQNLKPRLVWGSFFCSSDRSTEHQIRQDQGDYSHHFPPFLSFSGPSQPRPLRSPEAPLTTRIYLPFSASRSRWRNSFFLLSFSLVICQQTTVIGDWKLPYYSFFALDSSLRFLILFSFLCWSVHFSVLLL